MSRKTIPQKLNRLARFLFAANRPSVRRALERHGFDRETWLRGWQLLREACDARSGLAGAPGLPSTAALEREARSWVPVLEASLDAHHPALRSELLDGYEPVSGPALVPVLEGLLTRVDALASSPDPERNAARALLAKRGLTDEVVAALRDEIARVLAEPAASPDPSRRSPSDPPADANDRTAEADEEVSRYFAEWSRIARTAIADRNDLRALGFLRRRRAVEGEEGGEEVPVPGPVVDTVSPGRQLPAPAPAA